MYCCEERSPHSIRFAFSYLFSTSRKHGRSQGQSTNRQLRAAIMGISPPPGTPPAAPFGLRKYHCYRYLSSLSAKSNFAVVAQETAPYGEFLCYCGLQAHHLAITAKYLLKDIQLSKIVCYPTFLMGFEKVLRMLCMIKSSSPVRCSDKLSSRAACSAVKYFIPRR